MSKKEKLFVYLEGDYIGELIRATTGAVEFKYDNSCKTPLSLSLPIREQVYTGAEVYNYFDNLLPDNKQIRERLAQNTQSESIKPFDLLKSLGHECVGALEFYQAKDPNKEKSIKARPVSDTEIAERIRNLKKFPLGIQRGEDGFRISVAGMQEKTALLWHENQWKIPEGSTPTTHILKPPMGEHLNGIDLSTSVENEWLCLEICKAFGLKTASTEIKIFEDQKCLSVERFDRKWDQEVLTRIHQEDFCQALGIPSHLKYEADHRKDLGNRPDIETALDLLNQSDKRRHDRELFFKSQIVFFLLAATDGHAKNFSIFHTPGQFVMTPLYDVMSVYPALQSNQIQLKQIKMAMSIGDNRHYKYKEITAKHFEQTAKKNGIPKSTLNDIFEEIIQKSKNLESMIKLPKDFPDHISESIFNGCKKTSLLLET